VTIAQMQDEIAAAGWQWLEHVFNDGMGLAFNCFVKLSKRREPQVFTDPAFRDPDEVGWGRFNRHWAWQQAYDYVMEKENAKRSA